MGLLSTNRLQKIFGRAFRGVYAEGTLIQSSKVRKPNGTLATEEVARYAVSVQFDECTESMKQSLGYASTDCRAIILRDGLALDLTNMSTDCYLIGDGKGWNLNQVTTDPARSYFEARASLRNPKTIPVAGA